MEYLKSLLDQYKVNKESLHVNSFFIKQVLQPSLECHLVILSRQSSYLFKHATMKHISDLLLLFGNSIQFFDLATVLLEIACTILEKSSLINSFVSSSNIDAINTVVKWIWDLFESSSNDKSGLQKKVIHSFIHVLLPHSSEDQAKKYLNVVLYDSLESKQEILDQPEFYEIQMVYRFYIPCLFQVVAKEYEKVVANQLVGMIEKGGNVDCFSKSMMKVLLKKCRKGIAASDKKKESEPGVESRERQWVSRFARILNLIPIEFPTIQQTEILQYYLSYLLIEYGVQKQQQLQEYRKEQQEDVMVLGSLLNRYIEKRKDRSVLFSHPSLLSYFTRVYGESEKWIGGVTEYVVDRLCMIGSTKLNSNNTSAIVIQKESQVDLLGFFEGLVDGLKFGNEKEQGVKWGRVVAGFWKGCRNIDVDIMIQLHDGVFHSLCQFWIECWNYFICKENLDEDQVDGYGFVEPMVHFYTLFEKSLCDKVTRHDLKNGIEKWIQVRGNGSGVQGGFIVLLKYLYQNQPESEIRKWTELFFNTLSEPVRFRKGLIYN